MYWEKAVKHIFPNAKGVKEDWEKKTVEFCLSKQEFLYAPKIDFKITKKTLSAFGDENKIDFHVETTITSEYVKMTKIEGGEDGYNRKTLMIRIIISNVDFPGDPPRIP